jgi:TfoX/Sxy family transcriptional regulator of competence genes
MGFSIGRDIVRSFALEVLMAYDEGLMTRLRELVAADGDVQEKKMFGGVALMVGGNMACGIVKDELMVRVGPAAYAEALARPFARELDFTGRPMKGMVIVAKPGFAEDADLRAWVARGLAFARSLPAK